MANDYGWGWSGQVLLMVHSRGRIVTLVGSIPPDYQNGSPMQGATTQNDLAVLLSDV